MAKQRSIIDARADFPILQTQMNGKPLIYLDSASSAQKPQAVINAMSAVLEGGYANIHRGLYSISQDLTKKFEDTRAQIATFIGAESDSEIVFTRNATEAINLVVQSWGRAHLKAGDEIILSAMEHHANIVPWQILRDEIGFTIKIIPLNDHGALDLAALPSLLSNKTKFIGCVHISNALGTINDIQHIITTARSYNADIKILIDGSQSIVHMPVDVQKMDADFFTFTGHKLYAPTGIGVLYGKYETLDTMPPYQGGGDMIEHVSFEKSTFKKPPFRFEAGTPAITEVIGLGAAIEYLTTIGMDTIAAHEAEISAYAHERIAEIEGLKIHGSTENKIGVLSFTMDSAHSSDIGMVLDQMGIALRAGHHCCMPLMQELNVDSTVRASIGLYTNKDDIDALINALQKVKDLFG